MVAPIDRAWVEEFDRWPEAKRRDWALGKFIEVYDFARRHSPHYARKYGERTVRTWEEVAEIPLLTAEEVRTHVHADGTGDLLTGPTLDCLVFASSGTTGHPKVCFREHAEQAAVAATLGKGLRLALFRPTDRVINLFAPGSLWAAFLDMYEGLREVGCTNLPVGGMMPTEDLVRYIRTYRANGAIGLPSMLLSIAEYVERNGIEDVRLERISTSGEHLYDDARAYLKRVLGAEKITAGTLAGIEAGAIGFQCECCDVNEYHSAAHLDHLEIVDLETGKQVPDGEEGAIAFTTLNRRVQPLIRYPVGDRGRIIPEPCACGRTLPRLQLLGRSDDVLIIGGWKIDPNNVDGILGRFPELSRHFQIEAKIVDHKDLLCVTVESRAGASEEVEGVASQIKASIYAEEDGLRALFGAGKIHDVQVEVVPPMTLPRNPRNGKIRTSIDERAIR